MNKKNDPASVTDRLRVLCSRREYCSSDIYKKALDAMDGNASEAGKVLEKLQEEKYVDDRRYARAYARDKSSIVGWGSVKIRYMLSAKGVARDVIDEALAEVDADSADRRFEKLMLAKCRAMKEDANVRMKLIRFAAGRGYGYEQASSMADRIIRMNKENEEI
jgi:regulatory protein